MNSWTLKQLRALVLSDLSGHIPRNYFDQNIESLNLNDFFQSNEYLSFENNWGYLAVKIGKKLYFQPQIDLSPRQVAACELLMNLGMLAIATVSLNACEQIQQKALEKNIPDGNARNVATKLKHEDIPVFHNNIRAALEQYLRHLSIDEARPYVSLLGINTKQEVAEINMLQKPTEDIIELKPNFMGVGINLNALWRKIFKDKT